MSSVIWHVTMSLDGFIAGPNDSMDWAVAAWSNDGGATGDIEVQRSTVADDVLKAAGAILGGRRWYDVAVRQFDGYEIEECFVRSNPHARRLTSRSACWPRPAEDARESPSEIAALLRACARSASP
jgi:dihydrofolate reductase